MLNCEVARDAEVIDAFLRKDRELHVYELGDLDPFLWPNTGWWTGPSQAD